MPDLANRLARIAGKLIALHQNAPDLATGLDKDARWLLELAHRIAKDPPCQQCGRRMIPHGPIKDS